MYPNWTKLWKFVTKKQQRKSNHQNVPDFTQPWFQAKISYQKDLNFCQKWNCNYMPEFVSHTLKYKIAIKYHYKCLVNLWLRLKNTYWSSFPWNLKKKNSVKMRPKIHIQQNTVCLEQQIYASQENFSQPLLVMVETFRWSGVNRIFLNCNYMEVLNILVNSWQCQFTTFTIILWRSFCLVWKTSPWEGNASITSYVPSMCFESQDHKY